MKILKMNCLNGPNYWSNSRTKLIELTIDLEEYEFFPSNKLENFSKSLKGLMPSLYEHRCSEGIEGGFFIRLEEGTWLGHVIEHVALELQWLAGMKCGFGRTLSTIKEGVYQVIYAYEFDTAGLYAGKAAVSLVENLAKGLPHNELEKDIGYLKKIAVQNQFGPSTQAIINEAVARNIPIYHHYGSLLTLGYGVMQKKIWSTVSSQTSSIGADIASDKELTKKILATHGIPVPEGILVTSLNELEEISVELKYPLVTKPKNGNHGRGITTKIYDKEKLIAGFLLAQKISSQIIIESFIEGDDYRILVVNYKVIAVSKRTPPHIIGNGKATVEELITLMNEDPRRGINHENYLTKIELDRVTLGLLKEQGFDITSIVPAGVVLSLKDTANLSSGGSATDATDLIHSKNVLLAERIAKIIGLDICGIDLVTKNIQMPLSETNGAILEVNAGPGLRMHLAPNNGNPRQVVKPFLDMLFPNNDTGRIPVISVTGTNGKTTVVTLIAKLAQKNGFSVGYTSTEGIYINKDLIQEGDCSGPLSAQTVLQNPEVNFAVLECARGGILRSGLGFDECDVSIVTNITADHLGLKEINTLEELARVKSVVARSTKKTGYTILNADNDFSYLLKEEVISHVALFGLKKTERLIEHCSRGGMAAYLEESMIIIQWDSFAQTITHVNNIPLTFNGAATCMVQNILAVVLAAFISKIPVEIIKEFLCSLKPIPEILPGRMNLFHFPNYKIMIDYAHNVGAYKELKNYLSTLSFDKFIGIIAVPGDRRDEDIIDIGRLAGEIFDEIIIRHDKDLRIRTNEEITALLIKGINLNGYKNVRIFSDEGDAIIQAIHQVKLNSFIFCAVDKVSQMILFLKDLQKKGAINSIIKEKIFHF